MKSKLAFFMVLIVSIMYILSVVIYSPSIGDSIQNLSEVLINIMLLSTIIYKKFNDKRLKLSREKVRGIENLHNLNLNRKKELIQDIRLIYNRHLYIEKRVKVDKSEDKINYFSVMIIIAVVIVSIISKEIDYSTIVALILTSSNNFFEIIYSKENKSKFICEYVKVNKHNQNMVDLENKINDLYIRYMGELMVSNDFYEINGRLYYIVLFKKNSRLFRGMICLALLAIYIGIIYIKYLEMGQQGILSFYNVFPLLMSLIIFHETDYNEFMSQIQTKNIKIDEYKECDYIKGDTYDIKIININNKYWDVKINTITELKAMGKILTIFKN